MPKPSGDGSGARIGLLIGVALVCLGCIAVVAAIGGK